MSDPKKAPLDLVPLRALVGAARVLAHGNTKVIDGKPRAPGDFIERPLDGVFFASTLRHTMELQLLNGTVNAESLAALDADTKLPAIDHLICNLVIIRTMLIRDGVLPVDPGAGKRKEEPQLSLFKDAETAIGNALLERPEPPPRYDNCREDCIGRCSGCERR
jgi:hypothetical protein